MSSRSQSSSRRSSRSSGRSSKNKNKGGIKKTAAKDGANFWVMLAGFVFGMVVLLLIASLFLAPPANSDLLTATDDNRAEVATRAQRDDFTSFVGNANVEQLVEMLKSLQEVEEFDSNLKYFTNLQRRRMVVDSLMEQPLSDENRRLAVMARLKSTANLFWKDQTRAVSEADLGIRLREAAEKHVDDTDAEIAFEARIQLANLNRHEATSDPGAFAKELHRLLADFPSNKRVQDTIKSSLNFLVSIPEKRPATIKVLDHFFKLPKVTGNQETENLYTLLRDLESLCELNFFDAYDNVKFTEEPGRDQLRDVCLDLAEIPTAGIEVAKNLARSAYWLEINDHYDHAIDIYAALKASAERLPNKEDVVRFSRYGGSWGIKRCEAVGEPFNLAVSTYDGKTLKLSVFESMPVLVVFWSKTDGTESILRQIEKASQRWRRNSVKVITVQVEHDDFNFKQNKTRELVEQFPRWSFCYDDGSGTGPIFSQIPSGRNGRVALLDRKHNLYDVDVDLEELVTRVNLVLATRSDDD